MATWSLLHVRSPRNTLSGNGVVRELTKASSRQMTFSLVEPATLSFEMPGNNPQTAALRPLIDDVLVYRDSTPVQRFRVVSRVLEKSAGVLNAQFAAISYKGLARSAIFHPEYTLAYASTEQTAIAWNILQQAFGTSSANLAWLGITGRRTPAVSRARVLTGQATDYGPGRLTNYFQAGQTIYEGIDIIASMTNGFEWDIIPDATNPYTALYAGFWNLEEATGGRSQFVTQSNLLLTDGGTLTGWSHTLTPAEFANVIRYTGGTNTVENFTTGAAAAASVAWLPSTKIPAETATNDPPDSYGRWERDIQADDETTGVAGAQAAFNQANLYTPEISLDLARERWQGPSQLWLGDKARLIITEPITGTSDQYVLYIDEAVKVVQIDISIDDLGAEDVSLAVNRPKFNSARDFQDMSDKVRRMTRR